MHRHPLSAVTAIQTLAIDHHPGINVMSDALNLEFNDSVFDWTLLLKLLMLNYRHRQHSPIFILLFCPAVES